jgi:hypothetical protein
VEIINRRVIEELPASWLMTGIVRVMLPESSNEGIAEGRSPSLNTVILRLLDWLILSPSSEQIGISFFSFFITIIYVMYIERNYA